MRIPAVVLSWSAVAGIMLAAGVLLTAGIRAPRAGAPPQAVRTQAAARSQPQPFPAGDAPAFLLASVQPLDAPAAWRTIYHQVERCAGKTGDYDAIRWAVMEAPLQGPKGPTYAFTVGRRIVLVRNDTTYLRHEMLHHILEVSGWHPRPLREGDRYTIADLHPMPLFGLCTGGR
jgi:Zn-dependent protease with chaperone function